MLQAVILLYAGCGNLLAYVDCTDTVTAWRSAQLFWKQVNSMVEGGRGGARAYCGSLVLGCTAATAALHINTRAGEATNMALSCWQVVLCGGWSLPVCGLPSPDNCP